MLPIGTPQLTLMGGGALGEQEIQFRTHLALLRVGDGAESHGLAAGRARTDVTRAREPTATKAGNVHQRPLPAKAARPEVCVTRSLTCMAAKRAAGSSDSKHRG
jgi:hypothetical protein